MNINNNFGQKLPHIFAGTARSAASDNMFNVDSLSVCVSQKILGPLNNPKVFLGKI